MRIAVWKTGHPIADTVAQSLAEGFNGEIRDTRNYESFDELHGYDAHTGYGILRGTGDIYRRCEALRKEWFHLDRGYFESHHYDGYYRISYKGTQAKYDPEFPITKEYDGEFKPFRRSINSALICPPTDYVCDFFGIDSQEWCKEMAAQCWSNNMPCSIRTKDCQTPLAEHLSNIDLVITFNSSVGWEALKLGIPCISDPNHSVIGTYYGLISVDNVLEMMKHRPRKPLFDFMRSHQFTLSEIARGDAWPLIQYYLSISDGIPAKRFVQMLPPIASKNALTKTFSSIFSNTAN